MELPIMNDSIQSSAVGSPVAEPDADCFTPKLVAARMRAFEELQTLLRKGVSASGRNGRPWNEYMNEGRDR